MARGAVITIVSPGRERERKGESRPEAREKLLGFSYIPIYEQFIKALNDGNEIARRNCVDRFSGGLMEKNRIGNILILAGDFFFTFNPCWAFFLLEIFFFADYNMFTWGNQTMKWKNKFLRLIEIGLLRCIIHVDSETQLKTRPELL